MAKPNQKTVELLKEHEHAGRTYPIGASLTLDTDSADWLISIGVAKEPVVV